MKIDFEALMRSVGTVVETAGVLIILIGATAATGWFLYAFPRGVMEAYQCYRQAVGRAILLGLEFLIAGDIIRTVAVEPTLSKVAVLGVIVLIRTFLSISLQVELEGRWPWQARQQPPN